MGADITVRLTDDTTILPDACGLRARPNVAELPSE
jgi:hypothetical protein